MTSNSSIILEYPALYNTANTLSAGSQTFYLRLIRWEYLFLLLSSIVALNISMSKYYYVIAAITILIAMGLMIWRNSSKPEQDWYRGRALAESIKTSVWKYCMRAEPFGDTDKVSIRRSEFRNYLLGILDANRHIGDKLPADDAAKEQVTQSMEKVRALSLDERKLYYTQHRIQEQRNWYAKKAGKNKKASKVWFWISSATYLLAVTLSIFRVANHEWLIWPIEPFMLVASSILGWMQIKKFNELSASYTLTAHEIGIIHNKIHEIQEESEFSKFVNEAEQAFSREHTQWVARQHNP